MGCSPGGEEPRSSGVLGATLATSDDLCAYSAVLAVSGARGVSYPGGILLLTVTDHDETSAQRIMGPLAGRHSGTHGVPRLDHDQRRRRTGVFTWHDQSWPLPDRDEVPCVPYAHAGGQAGSLPQMPRRR